MVKKFFRKIFNKKEKSEITDETELSSEKITDVDEAPESILSDEDDGQELSEELDSVSLDNDLDEKIIDEEFIEEEIEHALPPIESDLPDLPAEVLKALNQNDSNDNAEEDCAEDEDFDFTEIKSTNISGDDISSGDFPEEEEDFDFTEIKSNKVREKLQDIDQNEKDENEVQDADEQENEIPFDFNELQVDLPGNNKSKIGSLIFKLKNLLGTIKNIKQGNQDQKALIDEVKKSQVHYLFVGLLVLFSSYYSGKLIALMLMGKESTVTKISIVNNQKKKNVSSIKELEKLNPLNALATSKKPDKNKKEIVKKVVIDEKKSLSEKPKEVIYRNKSRYNYCIARQGKVDRVSTNS